METLVCVCVSVSVCVLYERTDIIKLYVKSYVREHFLDSATSKYLPHF